MECTKALNTELSQTRKKKTRISLATVMFPYDELEIGPLESMVDDHRPRMYGKIKYGDYLRHTLERKMEGKAHVDILKLKSN